MAKKCVHKGCGKVYEDDSEPCIYHPGPPIFHEGQKGSPHLHPQTTLPANPNPSKAGNAANRAS